MKRKDILYELHFELTQGHSEHVLDRFRKLYLQTKNKRYDKARPTA